MTSDGFGHLGRSVDCDHVSVVVEDLGATRRFLCDILGFRVDEVLEHTIPGALVVFFRLGQFCLEAIWHEDAGTRHAALNGAQARIDHIALGTEDVAGWRDHLVSQHVELRSHEIAQIGNMATIWTEPESSEGVTYQFVQRTAADSKSEG